MPLTPAEIRFFLSRDDLARLASYAHNLVDYHMILDLLPQLARLYFDRRLGGVSLSALQETILIGQGLQHQDPSMSSWSSSPRWTPARCSRSSTDRFARCRSSSR